MESNESSTYTEPNQSELDKYTSRGRRVTQAICGPREEHGKANGAVHSTFEQQRNERGSQPRGERDHPKRSNPVERNIARP
jgi:hypothetical protein